LKIGITKIIRSVDKIIFKSKKFNLSDTILLAGSPRSGTTWLMELLETMPSYRPLFEPLNPNWFPESFKIGFQSRTYLPTNSDWPDGEDYLRRTFTGGVFSLQSRYSSMSDLKAFIQSMGANKLIIKYVRLNRLLPWVAKRFQLKKTFFIIRHPCAVVCSQLKTGFTAYHSITPPYIDIIPNLETILDELSKINGLDHDLLDKLRIIRTPEEILATIWCLDNYVPLSTSRPYPWTTIIYEKLVKDGEKEISRIFGEIGENDIPKSAIANLKIPSRLTQKSELKAIRYADEQLSKWKKYLSKKQIDRILGIVSDFGLDFYTNDVEPDYSRLHDKNVYMNH